MAIRSLKTGTFTRSGMAGNPVIMPGSYESIASATPSGTGTVTFSSIPQTYAHLQIRYFAKSTWAPGSIADVLQVRLNGNATANAYRYHSLYSGNGPSPSIINSSSTAFSDNFAMLASNLPTSTFAAGILDILDYTDTNKNTTVRLLSGVDSNNYYTGNFWGVGLSSGLWLNTAAVSSITLYSNNGNFPAGTSFALYGVN